MKFSRRRALGAAILIFWAGIVGWHVKREYFKPASLILAEGARTLAPGSHFYVVKMNGAAIGFALDPDADRLALIDENGRYIGEELTLALAVLQRLRHERGPVVINMSTSRVVEDVARQFGCDCQRSAVGEANVVALMRQLDALIGGEGNGVLRRGEPAGPRPVARQPNPLLGVAADLRMKGGSVDPTAMLGIAVQFQEADRPVLHSTPPI